MVSRNFSCKELQAFYNKLEELCPGKVKNDYSQGCHFVMMLIKRFIDDKDPLTNIIDNIVLSIATASVPHD